MDMPPHFNSQDRAVATNVRCCAGAPDAQAPASWMQRLGVKTAAAQAQEN